MTIPTTDNYIDHWGIINSTGEHMDLHNWFKKIILSIKFSDKWPIVTYPKETLCIVIKLDVQEFHSNIIYITKY